MLKLQFILRNMMVNNERVEKIATGIVDMLLNRTERLISDIASTDKMPSWDGGVRVYKKDSQEKEDLIGRVPVQVKGHYFDLSQNGNIFPDKIKFPVEASDLINYRNDSGAIFFVVYIDKNNNEKYKIYFNELLPYSLASILKKYPQKSFTVELNEFPTEKKEMVDIFLNFLNHRKYQVNLIQTGLPDEAVLKEKGVIKSYIIKCTSCEKPQNPSDLLFSPGKKFVYGDTKELGLGLIPLNEASEIKISNIISQPVSISGKSFYQQITWSRDKFENKYLLGKSIEIQVEKNKSITFQYIPHGTLFERINDIEFLEALIKTKKFCIGENEFDLSDGNDDGILSCLDILPHFKKLEKLIEQLEIKELFNFDLSELTKFEDILLNNLVAGLIDRQPIDLGANYGEIFIPEFEIHNFLIIAFAISNKDGKYNIHDFSNIHLPDSEFFSDKCPVSRYVFLKSRHLIKRSNIKYNLLLKDIKSYPLTIEHSNAITMLVLEMLSAYDQQEIKCGELLETVIELAQYIYDYDQNNIFLLNYLQAVKRKQMLTSPNIDKLLSIIKMADGSLEEKIGAAILLEDFNLANILYQQLSKSDQKNFDTFPINTLWINKDNKNVQ